MTMARRLRTAVLSAALAILAGLAGCTPIDTGFGAAVKTDYALQVIDPDPAARTGAQPGGSGVQAQQAAERYRKGTVKQPVSIETTTKTSGGGSN
jgi:hypothetical protein